MKCLYGLVFVIGVALAFDKQGWIAPLEKYAHFNEKNEVMIESECDETPDVKLVSKLFPEPTNTKVAQAISNGQDPTQFLDPLCYEREDPEVWKTLDNMVFGGEACGVEVRMDVFEKIGAFGNQKCDHGCNLGAIEASLQASWDKIQPFFDFLNDWLENSISPWSLKNPSCTEIVEPAIIAVRDAVVNSGNCKPKALAVFLDGGYGLFEKDDLGIESSAYSRCNSFRHHSEFFKSHYRQWPTDAHGIAQVIMSNMLVVGIERTS